MKGVNMNNISKQIETKEVTLPNGRIVVMYRTKGTSSFYWHILKVK